MEPDVNQQPYDPYAENSVMGRTDSQGVYFGDRFRMVWEKIKYYGIRIMPYIQRILTTIIFYTIRIIKSFIKIALDQLRLK